MTAGRQPLSVRPRGTARGGVPDDELRAAWTRWLGVLRARGLDPSPVLRPGAAPSALAVAEQAVGFTLPEPLRALYAITDGQESPADHGGPALFPAHEFCSLDGGVRAAESRELHDRWPLARDAADGLLVVERLPEADGRIVALGPDDEERVLASGLVDYLARLSVADLEVPAEGDTTVLWDAPDLR